MSPDERTNFERTLELGKALANDLDDRDLLGRWMAHHISDLITRARATTGPDSDALRQETCDTILKLWNHRRTAALRSRPTYNIDVVIQALERLEKPQDWLFYETFRPDEAPDQNTMASIPALKLALDLETNTRDIVIQILRFAANEAETKEAPWIQATEHLAEDRQRPIWKIMRQLDRKRRWRHLSTETDVGQRPADEYDYPADEADEPSEYGETAHVLAALRDTQARLTEICSAIERTIATPNTT